MARSPLEQGRAVDYEIETRAPVPGSVGLANLPPDPPKLCQICGDRALACNFGCLTCESCKAFFRRNAHRDDVKNRCKEDCQITIETRSCCKSCRLKKCFQQGMKKTLILNDVQRAERKRKIEENREKKESRDDNNASHDDYSENMCCVKCVYAPIPYVPNLIQFSTRLVNKTLLETLNVPNKETKHLPNVSNTETKPSESILTDQSRLPVNNESPTWTSSFRDLEELVGMLTRNDNGQRQPEKQASASNNLLQKQETKPQQQHEHEQSQIPQQPSPLQQSQQPNQISSVQENLGELLRPVAEQGRNSTTRRNKHHLLRNYSAVDIKNTEPISGLQHAEVQQKQGELNMHYQSSNLKEYYNRQQNTNNNLNNKLQHQKQQQKNITQSQHHDMQQKQPSNLPEKQQQPNKLPEMQRQQSVILIQAPLQHSATKQQHNELFEKLAIQLQQNQQQHQQPFPQGNTQEPVESDLALTPQLLQAHQSLNQTEVKPRQTYRKQKTLEQLLDDRSSHVPNKPVKLHEQTVSTSRNLVGTINVANGVVNSEDTLLATKENTATTKRELSLLDSTPQKASNQTLHATVSPDSNLSRFLVDDTTSSEDYREFCHMLSGYQHHASAEEDQQQDTGTEQKPQQYLPKYPLHAEDSTVLACSNLEQICGNFYCQTSCDPWFSPPSTSRENNNNNSSEVSLPEWMLSIPLPKAPLIPCTTAYAFEYASCIQPEVLIAMEPQAASLMYEMSVAFSQCFDMTVQEKMSKRPSMLEVFNHSEYCVKCIVRLVSKIRVFSGFCIDDQINLLKSSIIEGIVLQSVRAFDVVEEGFYIRAEHGFDFMSMELLRSKKQGSRLFQGYTEFALEVLRTIKNDGAILMCLVILCIFREKEKCTLTYKDPERIKRCYRLYLWTLYNYLSVRFNRHPEHEKTFERTMNLCVKIQTTCINFEDALTACVDEDLSPLLNEMLELSPAVGPTNSRDNNTRIEI